MSIVVHNQTLSDGTRWRETLENGRVVEYEIGRGDRDYSIKDMGGWWRLTGDFTPSRSDHALRRVRYDADDLDEIMGFAMLAWLYEENLDSWSNWAVSFDRALEGGDLLSVRKEIGKQLEVSYPSSAGSRHRHVMPVRPDDLEACAVSGRFELEYRANLEDNPNGAEIAALVADLAAIHARADRSTLVLGLAEGPLGIEHAAIAPEKERSLREVAIPAAQALIKAERRALHSMLHMAVLGVLDGSEIEALVGRDPDGDPFVGRVTTSSFGDVLFADEDPDAPLKTLHVPAKFVSHDGVLQPSAALALAIEMDWEHDDTREAIDAMVAEAWTDVHLIATKLLGIEADATMPASISEEIDRAIERLNDQIPEGVVVEAHVGSNSETAPRV